MGGFPLRQVPSSVSTLLCLLTFPFVSIVSNYRSNMLQKCVLKNKF